MFLEIQKTINAMYISCKVSITSIDSVTLIECLSSASYYNGSFGCKELLQFP